MEKPKFQLYNTMTKQKEDFKPKEEGKVGMYVCGVTAYDFSHIGHARAYVAFDVLYRYLKYLDYEVNYVRNFTDVDDKIIRRANELGEDPIQLSGRFCQEFLYDMTDLQCLPPTHQPRVSDHMDEIRGMIKTIIQNECAYSVDGDVYFSVDKFPAYGRLSGRKLEDNRAGERIAVDTRKRNPADFALWKAAKPGEPSWESPWGPGRPGWHIECSAMSARYLTPSFDIHGGGMDLIFPHHENELAQSCAACSDSNIKYWLHNGFVTENNEKMSKSLGNFFTIRDITKQYHPLALRYFLMSTHYRSPVNYSTSQLEIASDSVFYIYQTLCDIEDALSQFQEKVKEGKNAKAERITSEAQDCINKLRSDFQSKMADDLHTQDILNASLLETLRLMNKSLDALKKKKQQQQQQPLFHSLVALEKEVKNVMETLGLLSSSTYSEVLRQLKEKALGRAGLTEEDVSSFIEERVQARKNKEYAKSDQIRLDLKAKGIALMDLGNETIWRPCVPAEPEQPVQRQQPVAPVSTHVQQDQPVKLASSPVQQSQPVAPVSTPLQEEQPVAPVFTPVQKEQPVALVSTPVVEKQPVAPVSTTVREEQPVAPVSTPVVEKQPVLPVSTPVREEQPVVAVTTPVLEEQSVAPISTLVREEQPVAPIST